MVHENDVDLVDRVRSVVYERGVASVNEYADDLDVLEERPEETELVEQNPNPDYFEELRPFEDGEEAYLPFLFTKGMPLETDEDGTRLPEGLVDARLKREAYLDVIRDGEFPSAPGAFPQGGDDGESEGRLFIGYPAVHTVGLYGMDAWRGIMPGAPGPTGPRMAGEMVDAYAMEQVRDVPFVDWPGEATTEGSEELQKVVGTLKKDIAEIEEAVGEEWWYDPERPFVEGDPESWGPYLSQFLLQDVNMWALPIEQQYKRYEQRDYNDTREDWLDTLEGKDQHSAEVNPNVPEGGTGYIATPRHLATIVNAEPPFQEYLLAALYLLDPNTAAGELDPGLAYVSRDNDGGVFNYTGGGPVGLLDMVTRAGRQALLAAFYQKYYVHFRCRPETYAGRIHAQRRHDGVDFGISELVTNSETLSTAMEGDSGRTDDTDYLSTVYVEGSPVHPAYPSGHSVIAGACGTVLKTWFENTDWEDEYERPDATGGALEDADLPAGHRGVHQEIDKLMSNVGLARMFAGVHYYSDHYWGVRLGEQVAVGMLSDVFDRTFDAAADIEPTFTPFLGDETYEVSAETLEGLRRAANAR